MILHRWYRYTSITRPVASHQSDQIRRVARQKTASHGAIALLVFSYWKNGISVQTALLLIRQHLAAPHPFNSPDSSMVTSLREERGPHNASRLLTLEYQ
jgi:hypothetical protein